MSDDHNAHLLHRITDAFREHDRDTIPPHLGAAARDAFAWRLVDARLAELLFDSAHDELVGVRGAANGRRSFRYGADDFVIRVHLTSETLVAMIEPPLSVACRIVTEESADDHRTDELGELAVAAPELPFRLEVDLPSGRFVTPWVTG